MFQYLEEGTFLFLIINEIHTSAGADDPSPASPLGFPVVCCNIARLEHNFPIIDS